MSLVHGVQRLPGGGLRIQLASRERELLASLPDQLRPILTGEEDPGQIRARLFPRAYDDPEQEAEYRELVGDTLLEERLEKLDAFSGALDAGEEHDESWTLDLSEEDGEAWLSALNDARLALASIVGIQHESDWEAGPDPEDSTAVALWYLGWLQEELLAALRSSPED